MKINLRLKVLLASFSCSFLFFLSLVFCSELQAQPDWKINPHEFEYNMTVTCIAILSCDYIKEEGDLLGAFVDDQLRGVGKFDVVDQGRNYCFLTVYDTLFSGHKVQFRIYDASEDTIYYVQETITFADNKIVGSSSNPFIFQIESPLKDLVLDLQGIHREDAVGTKIGRLYLRSIANDTLSARFNFINDSLGLHNEIFSIQGNDLILEQDIHQIKDSIFSIHIRGENNFHCTKDTVIKIKVNGSVANGIKSIMPQPIVIFPNPTQDEVYFTSETLVDRIIIMNESGKLVKVVNLQDKKSIDLTGFPSGTYILHFESSGKRIGVFKVLRVE